MRESPLMDQPLSIARLPDWTDDAVWYNLKLKGETVRLTRALEHRMRMQRGKGPRRTGNLSDQIRIQVTIL